ncbi:MAG: dual specificity protein phosphatase family protein [Chitinispirillaceae bacterium]|nr:dual specificity protein phosphatase family protein [Chitinispirillaceae bacterium]
MSLHNFSWVIPGKLAGSDLPGGGSPALRPLRDDVEYLVHEGVRILVSLVRPEGPVERVCEASGMQWRYFPIPDFSVPDVNGSFPNLVDECIRLFTSGSPVCIHCQAGIGRTGLVLSCIVGAYLQLDGRQAVSTVQAIRTAVETEEQRRFVVSFLKAYES